MDYTVRQVAADPEERTEMKDRVGTDEIPVLVTDAGEPIPGERYILEYLEGFEERTDAPAHRDKSRAEVPEFAA